MKWLRSRPPLGCAHAHRGREELHPAAIGRQLELSSKTVETYRSRIYEKLRLRMRADLVHYAMVVGLLDESPGESL
jgi:DNA-binding CsgD family transcriptional regulator